MDEQTKRFLIKRIGEVPADIRELILSDTLADDIEQIAKKHSLNEDQKDSLQAEIRLVLLGVTDLDLFAENIRSGLNVGSELTSEIVVSVDEEVLSLVRNSLNNIHGYVEYENINHESEGATEDISQQKVGTAQGEVTADIPQKDPVAANILSENRQPGSQRDPYREPIE